MWCTENQDAKAYLLLELLSVGGALQGAQVEGAVCRVAEALQLLLLVPLLGGFNGPLLLGGTLMRGWGGLRSTEQTTACAIGQKFLGFLGIPLGLLDTKGKGEGG